MTEFEPLRETSTSAFERALLGSADRDAPSERAFTRTAAALGVGGALLGTAGNTAAAVGGSGGVATVWTMLLKPLVIGAAGGLVVAVGSHRLSAPSSPPTSALVSSAPSPSAPSVRESTPARFEAPVKERETPLPAPARRTAETSPRASSPNANGAKPLAGPPSAVVPAPEASASSPPVAPTSTPAGSVSIASELANVDRARQALREGRAADALHELDVYRLSWPSGVLATEAAVLRIEAHLALGDRMSGVRAARAFLAANPSGRYAVRVRALFKPSELE